MKKLFCILIVSIFLLAGCAEAPEAGNTGGFLKIGGTPQKEIVKIAGSTMPEAENYVFTLTGARDISTLCNNINALTLTEPVENRNEYTGMTDVLELSYSDGNKSTLYIICGKWIRLTDENGKSSPVKEIVENKLYEALMSNLAVFRSKEGVTLTGTIQYSANEEAVNGTGYFTGKLGLKAPDDVTGLLSVFNSYPFTDSLMDCGWNWHIVLDGEEYRLQTRFRSGEGYVEHDGKGCILTGTDFQTVKSICESYLTAQGIVYSLPEVMPDDFAIHYETWIVGKDIYDTYEGYLQKDLVFDGTKRTALSVSEEQLSEIYKAVRESSLNTITREMTSSVLKSDDLEVRCIPLTHYSIAFTVGGQKYTATGDWTASAYTDTDDDAAHFWSFIQYMNNLLYNSEEYKSLPEPNGGYE